MERKTTRRTWTQCNDTTTPQTNFRSPFWNNKPEPDEKEAQSVQNDTKINNPNKISALFTSTSGGLINEVNFQNSEKKKQKKKERNRWMKQENNSNNCCNEQISGQFQLDLPRKYSNKLRENPSKMKSKDHMKGCGSRVVQREAFCFKFPRRKLQF